MVEISSGVLAVVRRARDERFIRTGILVERDSVLVESLPEQLVSGEIGIEVVFAELPLTVDSYVEVHHPIWLEVAVPEEGSPVQQLVLIQLPGRVPFQPTLRPYSLDARIDAMPVGGDFFAQLRDLDLIPAGQPADLTDADLQVLAEAERRQRERSVRYVHVASGICRFIKWPC